MAKWRVAIIYEIEGPTTEEEAYEAADAMVAGEDIDATYDGVWTERADPSQPLGPVHSGCSCPPAARCDEVER